MRRNSAPGVLSRKLLNRSSVGPSRVSALAVRPQPLPNLPLVKNASRPYQLSSLL
jgi:hypothetical protein